MNRRPEFYTHDPAVNALASAGLSTLAKGVDAALNDLAWVTAYATCSVSLDDARRQCRDVPDFDLLLPEMLASGRWIREGDRLISTYLLDRKADVIAFTAQKAAAGRKGGRQKAVNAAAQLALGLPGIVQDAPPREIPAQPSSANQCQAEPSTPYPVQNTSSVLPSGDTELVVGRAAQTLARPTSQTLDAKLAALLHRVTTTPPRPDPVLA